MKICMCEDENSHEDYDEVCVRMKRGMCDDEVWRHSSLIQIKYIAVLSWIISFVKSIY